MDDTDLSLPHPPDIPDRRRYRDLAALALMGVGVTGFIGTLFVMAPMVGTLAVFAAVGGLGVLLGTDTD